MVFEILADVSFVEGDMHVSRPQRQLKISKLSRPAAVLLMVCLGVFIVRSCYRTAASPLIDAACDGDVDRCRRLVELGTPVDSVDRNKNTALIWAVYESQKDVVEALLNLGANADHLGESAITPLMCTGCPLRGHALQGTDADRNEIAKLLLQHGAKVNRRLSSPLGDGETALYFAAESRNADLVQTLLAAGADKGIMAYNRYTPLDVAKFPNFAPNGDVIALLEKDKK